MDMQASGEGGENSEVEQVVSRSPASTMWTPGDVKARLREALETLSALPDKDRQMAVFRSNMPDAVRNPWDAYERSSAKEPKPGVPSAEAIDRMDEALSWLSWLAGFRGGDSPKIIVFGLLGASQSWIKRRTGHSRWTQQRRRKTGLIDIAAMLNAKSAKKKF